MMARSFPESAPEALAPGGKVRIVGETYLPGISVSLVARQHGSGSQTFNWRRPVEPGPRTAAGAGEEVVPASDFRALQNQAAELQRMLSKRNGSRDTARGRLPGHRPQENLLLRSMSLLGEVRRPRHWASAASTCRPCTTD
jgi:transposase